MAEPWPDPAACTAFDESAAELAFGLLDAADADALLAHAARCDRCRLELDSLAAAADRLTLLAPEAEPPAGFERRAVVAMGVGRSPSRRRLALAAAAIVLGLAAGVLIGRWSSPSAPAPTVASGVLLDSGGTSRGVVTVVRGDRPSLVMSLAGVDGGGTYRCSVRTPDGHVTEVADWEVPGTGGTWQVMLPEHLGAATEAIVTEDGETVATATLH